MAKKRRLIHPEKYLPEKDEEFNLPDELFEEVYGKNIKYFKDDREWDE